MSETAYRRALEILAAYFSGALDDDLMRDIRRWLISGRGGTEKHEALYRYFEEGFQFQETPPETAYRSFEEVSKRLGLQEMSDEEYDRLARGIYHKSPDAKPAIKRRVFTGSRLLLRFAAVLIPPLLAGGVAWLFFDRPVIQQSAMVTMAVPDTLGAQCRIDLTDGSNVFIRPGSSVSYAEDFGSGDKRRVVISGEAYFDVAKDSLKQFIVETAGINVTVLGTRFDVEASPDKEFTTITLYQGLVDVSGLAGMDGVGEVRLQSGSRLLYNNLTSEYRIEEVAAVLPGWIAERLSFVDAGHQEIIRVVEWFYGVRVEVDGAFTNETKMDFHFSGREDIATAMWLFQGVSREFTYVISDDAVKIKVTNE